MSSFPVPATFVVNDITEEIGHSSSMFLKDFATQLFLESSGKGGVLLVSLGTIAELGQLASNAVIF